MAFALCANGFIHHWVDGHISTDQLHCELTDPEYLRALRDEYAERLIDRWWDIAEQWQSTAEPQ